MAVWETDTLQSCSAFFLMLYTSSQPKQRVRKSRAETSILIRVKVKEIQVVDQEAPLLRFYNNDFRPSLQENKLLLLYL